MVRRLALVFATAVTAAGSVFAAKARDNPLDRITPVPAGQPVPIIDFFRPPLLVAPALNPSGTHFAALVSSGVKQWDLAIFDLAAQKRERLTGGAEYDVGTFAWQSDDRVLFTVIRDSLYASGLFVGEVGRLHHAYPINRHDVVQWIGFPRQDPRQAIVWIMRSSEKGGAPAGVRRIDIARPPRTSAQVEVFGEETGTLATIVRHYPDVPTGEAIDFLADLQGELAFAISTRDGHSELFRLADGAWQPCPVDLDQVRVLAVGTQPNELLVLEPRRENQPRAVRTLDAATGELGAVVGADEAYDLEDVRFYRHVADGRVLGLQYSRKGPDAVWLDARYRAVQAGLAKVFPELTAQILGNDRAERNFLVRTFSDTTPSTYYVVDAETWATRRLTHSVPWIDPQRMQRMRLISYKTRDGKSVDGYVTLPSGASKEHPAPLVVLPHGGPWTRNTWGWNPEVQFLASRGYAVFQPNYRGSDGTRWRFPEEDAWAFRKMHDDVTDGVRTLVRSGLVDADRLAIMGTSFGGYLAVCGAAFEPGLYRCAITVAGVFDWELTMRDTRRANFQRGGYGVLRRGLGDPQAERAAFDAISPLRAVDQIRIPVFVAHGTEDYIASVGQSKRLIAELKQHDVPFEAVIERDEGHGFAQLDNQIELYGAIEKFLATHLTPRPPVAGQ